MRGYIYLYPVTQIKVLACSTGAINGAPTNCLIYYGGCSDYMVKTVGVFGGAYRNPPPTNVRGYTYVNPFVLVKVVICCGLLRL